MAIREVRVDGVTWSVWEVHPGTKDGTVLFPMRPEFAGGWLAVARPGEKRRIVPIPDGWESWSDEVLAAAVRQAPRVGFGAEFPRRLF